MMYIHTKAALRRLLMGAGATAVTVADSIVKVSLIKLVGAYF